MPADHEHISNTCQKLTSFNKYVTDQSNSNCFEHVLITASQMVQT